MKKRLLAILLAVCLVVSLAPSVLAADNFTPVLPDGVTSESFANETTVTDGTNYYATLIDALAGIHGTENAVLYCKPEADVGTMTHGHVCRNLTIYGNGAYVSSGEQDFELDTYLCTGQSGSSLTGEVTLKVMNLDGCGAWGQRNSAHTLNIVFENCKNMNRVYITGTSGANNITLTDCSFAGSGDATGNASACTLYSNANGAITVTDTTFNGVYAPINLNHKVSGTQTISISGCTFTSCGYGDYEYAAPIRVLSSVEGGSSVLTVSGCTFTETVTNAVGQNADVLLDYGVGTATATVSSTAANVLTETESNVGNSVSVSATESQIFRNYEPVAQIGDVKYATLQAAVDAAQTDDEIKMLSSVTVDSLITVNTNVTLDLNGFEIEKTNTNDASSFLLKVASGTTTIMDSSEAGTGSMSAVKYVLNIADGASVILNSGNLIAEGNRVVQVVGGNFTVNGGALDGKSNAAISMFGATNDAVVTVNGGTLNAKEFVILANGSDAQDNCSATINGGILTSANDIAIYWPATGKLSVSGGTIIGATAIYMKSGSLNIAGGTFVANGTKQNYEFVSSDAIATGDALVIENVGGSTGYEEITSVSITGGTFTSENAAAVASYTASNGGVNAVTGFISGGTFNKAPAEILAAPGNIFKANEDGTYGVVPDAATAVAEVNGVGYTSLQDAVNAVENGGTVTLLQNVELDSGVRIYGSTTLDLNGCAISISDTFNEDGVLVVRRGAHLTIADSSEEQTGSINGENKAVAVKMTEAADGATGNAASLTVNGGTLIGRYYAISGNGSRDNTSIIINGGKIVGSEYTGIYQPQNGTLTITGGEISGHYKSVDVRSGSLFISGGELKNGLYIENIANKGYEALGTLSITGGIFTDGSFTDGTPMTAIHYENTAGGTITGFISGGTYSDNSAESYLADGYVLESYINDEGETVYGVEPVYTVTITFTPDDALIVVEDSDGNEIDAEDDGTYKLVNGTYTYTISKEGYTTETGSFNVNGANQTIEISLSEIIYYTVTYTDGVNGVELFEDQINFVAAGSPTPAFVGTPTRSGYTFAGWTPEVSATVTEDVTYTATWSYDYPDIVIPTTYSVTVKDSIGGEVDANRSYATAGTIVKLTVTPDDGYELDTLTVKAGSREISTTYQNGTYNFTMPYANVTVTATFKKVDAPDVSDECPGDWTCPMNGYTDLDRTAWYHDGIHFCIENDLMQGIGNNQFDPNGTTTRAMIVTILWRLEGSPVVNYAMDFEDVAAGQWYTEAIRWAASEKIVAGYGNGNFGTNDAITREQMVTIMYRYAQYKGYDVSVGENTNILSYDDAFDVAEWAIPAMQWACGSGMIQGIADGSAMNLAPQGNATRAQSAAILQRFCENVAEN